MRHNTVGHHILSCIPVFISSCENHFFFHALSVLSLSRRFYCARDDTSTVACCPQQGLHDPTKATSMKTSLKNRLRILLDVFTIIPIRPVTQKKGILVGTEEKGRARVQTEMVEFIALSFPYSSKLKVWSFHVVVVQGQQRNVQKSVMHVQSCCFLTFSLPSPSQFRKVPKYFHCMLPAVLSDPTEMEQIVTSRWIVRVESHYMDGFVYPSRAPMSQPHGLILKQR